MGGTRNAPENASHREMETPDVKGRERKLPLVMKKIVQLFPPGVNGHHALSLVVEERGIGRENAKLMENQSALVNALDQYKSLSLAAKTSAQSGVSGTGGAAALLLVGRELRLESELVRVWGSVQGRRRRTENAKIDPVQHGVLGETGQAAQLHVGRGSETGSGNADLQPGNKMDMYDIIKI